MASRHWSNAITSLLVDGGIVDGGGPIRDVSFHHFQSHFRIMEGNRPEIDNLVFKTLSWEEGAGLINPFSMEEVKQAEWIMIVLRVQVLMV